MLGGLLKRVRKQHQLTLKQLEERYKAQKGKGSLDAPLLSRYERGYYQLSKDRLLEILTKAFEYSPQEAQQVLSEYIIQEERSHLPEERFDAILREAPSDASEQWSPCYRSLSEAFSPSSSAQSTSYKPFPPDLTWTPEAFYTSYSSDEFSPDIQQGDELLVIPQKGKLKTNAWLVCAEGDDIRLCQNPSSVLKILGQVVQITRRLP